jgi:uncharacterized protein YndB with AHSA1/START domain
MKTLQFSIEIHASREKVWRTMLDPQSYKIWTAEFMAGSYYEGSWERGKKIKFLGPGGTGMTAVIAENKPYEFVSIKHLGFIKEGVEDTESPEIKAWTPAFENYTFKDGKGVTELKIDIDILPDFEEYMEKTWPKAMQKLKQLCE